MELFPWTARIWPLRADTPKKNPTLGLVAREKKSTREIARKRPQRRHAYRQAMVGDDPSSRARDRLAAAANAGLARVGVAEV